MRRRYLGLNRFYLFLLLFCCVAFGLGDGQSVDNPREDNSVPPCGIENCHGAEITCGPQIPEVCSAMYGLGDFCRAYAHCEIKAGQCQIVKDPHYDSCRTCIEKCQNPEDPVEAFNCETECRKKFE